jgi:hypothetical protein
MFALTTRLAAWLRLARREETRKTAEILLLRHQHAILPRQQPRRPKLNWADRALLATLFTVIPKARRHGLRLLVTPDTIVRWHRDIVRHRQAARSMRGKTGRPATGRNIRALVLLCRSEMRFGPVTCGFSVGQAVCVYSLIRPLRTGLRWIRAVSRSVTVARGCPDLRRGHAGRCPDAAWPCCSASDIP